MDSSQTEGLTLLGSKHTEYTSSGPCSTMLEVFPNKYPEREYLVTHRTEEWSSLCPKTGQPDFATVEIHFIPDQVCVETKSLKLYFFAYRQEGCFMETIANRVLEDLVAVLSPRWCSVFFRFSPRGGIETTVHAEYSK